MMASEHSCVCVYASAALVRVCECGLLYILFSFSSFLLASASSSRLALASMRSLDKLTLRDLRVLICLFICLLFENLFMVHGQQHTVAWLQQRYASRRPNKSNASPSYSHSQCSLSHGGGPSKFASAMVELGCCLSMLLSPLELRVEAGVFFCFVLARSTGTPQVGLLPASKHKHKALRSQQSATQQPQPWLTKQ